MKTIYVNKHIFQFANVLRIRLDLQLNWCIKSKEVIFKKGMYNPAPAAVSRLCCPPLGLHTI